MLDNPDSPSLGTGQFGGMSWPMVKHREYLASGGSRYFNFT